MILDWLKESLENLFISRRKKRLKRRKLRKKRSAKRPSSKKRVKKVRSKTLARKAARPKTQKRPIAAQRVERRTVAAKSMAPKAGQDRATELRRLRASSAFKTAPSAPLPRRLPPRATKAGVRVGSVTHYFAKIQVAVMKAERGLKTGDKIDVRRKGVSIGKDTVRSMQINHIPIDEARSGEEIGMKLLVPAQFGDEIFIL